jgi:hypothetical protein
MKNDIIGKITGKKRKRNFKFLFLSVISRVTCYISKANEITGKKEKKRSTYFNQVCNLLTKARTNKGSK